VRQAPSQPPAPARGNAQPQVLKIDNVQQQQVQQVQQVQAEVPKDSTPQKQPQPQSPSPGKPEAKKRGSWKEFFGFKKKTPNVQ
jgi:hypothetical protein